MYDPHYLIQTNREQRRKVERYMRKHPGITFTQAFNIIYHTDYNEPPKDNTDTSVRFVKINSTENDDFNKLY